MKKLKGIPISPGVVVYESKVLFSENIPFPERFIVNSKVKPELKRFEAAVEQTAIDLKSTKDRVSESIGHDFAEIFDSHYHILMDEAIRNDILFRIEQNLYSAEHAVTAVFKKYKKMFSGLGRDHFLSQRISDLDDIERRLLKILMGVTGDFSRDLRKDAIYVAYSLRPSQAALLNIDCVKGVITETGGTTSHFAIMVRAIGIPGIVGVEGLTREVLDGQTIILDGNSGSVIIDPDEKTLKKYKKLAIRFSKFEETIVRERHLPAETIDGYRVSLLGNIEFPVESQEVVLNGGEGVGLYRTEFLFVDANQLPNEKQHLSAYLEAAKILKNKPFTIRTMDLGADKFSEVTGGDKEQNPFLGCRSIRFCFENPIILKTQLRAILQVSMHASIKILFPMITAKSEIVWALDVLQEVKDQLTKEGIAFKPDIPVGIMIEVPSAAIIANDLAKLVDFFSIGTNDLIQYTLAVDRDNKRVSRLYTSCNPAVLELIKHTIEMAHKNEINVSLCGEMAGDPILVPLLMGMGLTEFSMSSHSIPFVKNLVRNMTWSEISELTKIVLSLKDVEDIKATLFEFVSKRIPDYFISD